MRIHHLNCATLCPHSARLINGQGGLLAPARLVCHCLLVETPEGLLLVDTGLGLQDVRQPGLLAAPFRALVRPLLDEAETAVRQIERLGFRADDVRHIVLTHLDPDHAGGLPDFPRAQVHVLDAEHRLATQPPNFFARHRYAGHQWAHQPNWQIHAVRGERWEGFEAVRLLEAVKANVLLVPLFGHTLGHCGVAVETPQGWILHAGDAYFHHDEIHAPARRCPVGADLFQRAMQMDGPARLANQARLRELARLSGERVRVVCAHDPSEFAACGAPGLDQRAI